MRFMGLRDELVRLADDHRAGLDPLAAPLKPPPFKTAHIRQFPARPEIVMVRAVDTQHCGRARKTRRHFVAHSNEGASDAKACNHVECGCISAGPRGLLGRCANPDRRVQLPCVDAKRHPDREECGLPRRGQGPMSSGKVLVLQGAECLLLQGRLLARLDRRDGVLTMSSSPALTRLLLMLDDECKSSLQIKPIGWPISACRVN